MELSSQRARTRMAILDAAAAQWARDPTVGLGQIARAAGVGRATIHRYFSDRHVLHAALVSDSWAALRAMIDRANPGTGSAAEVIDKLVSAMVHAGDRMLFLFAATEGTPAGPDADAATHVDDLMIAEIQRGQREGALDPHVPARWAELMIWSTVYTGLRAASDDLIPRHDVENLIRSTLHRAL